MYAQVFLTTEIFRFDLDHICLSFHATSLVYKPINTTPAFINTEKTIFFNVRYHCTLCHKHLFVEHDFWKDIKAIGRTNACLI